MLETDLWRSSFEINKCDMNSALKILADDYGRKNLEGCFLKRELLYGDVQNIK